MSSHGSITAWIDQLRAGDPAAAQPLWQGYFQRMVGLARQKLRGRLRTAMAGAEDVALSAFDSFCRGAEQGRFPQLADRDDLWRLLFVITERKAIDLVKHENAIRRGGGKVRHEGSRVGGQPHRRMPPVVGCSAGRHAPCRGAGQNGRLHEPGSRRPPRPLAASRRTEIAVHSEGVGEGDEAMSGDDARDEPLSLSVLEEIDEACDRFEQAWPRPTPRKP
jgi:hypothetical protein